MEQQRKHKLLRAAVSTAAVIVSLLLCYHVIGCSLAAREVNTAPRHDDGILIGAGEYSTGPEDSTRAVLLVHGHVGATSNFGELPDRLAEAGWHARAMRLPGHGTTPHDYADTTPEELIAAVEEELAALKEEYEPVAIVGHSMGGTLSTIVASETEVDAIVLAAPYFGVTYHWYYILPPEWWTRIVSPVVRWVYKGDVFMQVNRKEAKDDIVSYAWVPTKSLLTLQGLGHTASDKKLLNNIESPVLWLHSPADQAASYEEAQKAFENMGSEMKEHVPLPRANHHLFFDYEREEAVDAIVGFLGRVAPEQPAIQPSVSSAPER